MCLYSGAPDQPGMGRVGGPLPRPRTQWSLWVGREARPSRLETRLCHWLAVWPRGASHLTSFVKC